MMPSKTDSKESSLGGVPNTFLYNGIGLGIAVTISRFVFGMKIRRDKEVVKMKGPLVCVGNHPSFLDPIIMAAVLFGRKINFVAGTFIFRNRIVGPVFAKGGAIPKTQFRSDSKAVKGMLTALKRGGTLGIFPEATRLVDGTSIHFDDALARMIKKTDSAIAVMATHGAYMTWPRWSKSGFRRGRITAEIKSVLSSEQTKEMSVEEIHEYLIEQLSYSEYDYFRDQPRKFRNKAIASGAQNVAHACPRCEKDNVMVCEKDLLICSSCGNRVRMEPTGFFHADGEADKSFPDIHQWVNWEKDRMRKRILDRDFQITENVRLLLPLDEHEFRLVGSGVLTISEGRVVYTGTQCPVEEGVDMKRNRAAKKGVFPDSFREGEKVEKEFPVDRLRGLKLNYGKSIELIEAGGQINRFLPDHPQRIFEMQTAIEAMRERIDKGK
ncbi:MAG: 1-acyl-sn-glycerol-3-phosphate acyltransferase [Clostridiaceae bacterium]|mgnify:CR=1 FL=1|nr:1-acyl-sn-glycerol-3-phosphate acyltransferase [Clostridiaceae bacterium]